MITELLTALELLIAATKEFKGPAAKRRKIAKQLIKIYFDLEQVVERGNRLVSFLRGESTQVYQVILDEFIEQKRAVDSIIDSLNHPAIKTLLGLHLSFATELKVIATSKGERLGYYLSQLVTANEVDVAVSNLRAEFKRTRTKYESGQNAREIAQLRRQLKKREEKFDDIKLLHLREQFDLMRLEAADLRLILSSEEANIPRRIRRRYSRDPFDEGEEEWSDYYEGRPGDKRYIRIFATTKDVADAKNAVADLARMKEQFRHFLTEKFQLEDII